MQFNEKPYLTGRTFMFSIQKGQDLLQSIEFFCHHNQIRCATLTGIGAVEKATFGVYNQKTKKYAKINLSQDLEILSLNGNISLFDDQPMVHGHIMFADIEGKAHGGHLMAGTKVFSCELHIQELSGEMKVRKLEKATQLPLWSHPLCLK